MSADPGKVVYDITENFVRIMRANGVQRLVYTNDNRGEQGGNSLETWDITLSDKAPAAAVAQNGYVRKGGPDATEAIPPDEDDMFVVTDGMTPDQAVKAHEAAEDDLLFASVARAHVDP